MTISIITVTLNSGKLLNDTVESVKQQVYEGYEHIIKDGMSIDHSLAQLSITPRQKIIQSKDSGIYDAMNQALVEASGDYVIFLNSGDRFCDKYSLKRFVEEVEDNDYPDLVYGCICDQGAIIRYPKILSKWFMFRNALCHQSYMLKAEFLRKCSGFDLFYKVLSDHDLMLKLILLEKIRYHFCNEVLVSIYPMGFSAKNLDIKRKERKILIQKYFNGFGYFLFNFLFSLTMPRLRGRIIKNTRLKRMYYSIIK